MFIDEVESATNNQVFLDFSGQQYIIELKELVMMFHHVIDVLLAVEAAIHHKLQFLEFEKVYVL